jgi:hypothetical protein
MVRRRPTGAKLASLLYCGLPSLFEDIAEKDVPLVDIGLEFWRIVRLMMTWRAGVSTPL